MMMMSMMMLWMRSVLLNNLRIKAKCDFYLVSLIQSCHSFEKCVTNTFFNVELLEFLSKFSESSSNVSLLQTAGQWMV